MIHNSPVRYSRDPVSELFDAGARRLLARAYANPGTWQGTRLANPSQRHLDYLASMGIDWGERDRVGSGLARNRWTRGFVRSIYYQHKWYSPSRQASGWRRRSTYRSAGGLTIEVGRALPGGKQAGTVLLPGRAVRVKLEKGGQAKVAAVAKIPERKIWADQGPAWADPADRDWG